MTDAMTAPPLRDVQTWLLDALAAEAFPARDRIERHLTGSTTFPAQAGLAIYRRAYRARLAKAMRTQFPGLCHALGESLFDDFVADYIRTYPPSSYTLHDLGRRFAGFLDEQRPDADARPGAREPWIDFVVELARFERLVFILYDAPGSEQRDRPTPPVADERLWLQPAVLTDTFAFNVADYHTAVRRGLKPPAPNRGCYHLALVRSDHVVRIVALDEIEASLCRHMREGRCFADAVGIVSGEEITGDRAIPAIAQIRDRWMRWGMFVEQS